MSPLASLIDALYVSFRVCVNSSACISMSHVYSVMSSCAVRPLSPNERTQNKLIALYGGVLAVGGGIHISGQRSTL